MKVLKFKDRLKDYRKLKRLSIGDMAKACGITYERMEDIYEGTHAPGPADVLRIQRGLEIEFDPEDFEEYGLS